MSNTPWSPARQSSGPVQTWVISQWKFLPSQGQFSTAINIIGPGPNHRQRFAEAQAKAEVVMDGWRKGDWFYCGIVLSVALEGVVIASHAASLWGIETNYPGT